ncbi:MAG: anti-sigma factor family protein [Syntrophothermus sp.]
MRTESCRDRRESLGAYALGHLSDDERAALEAHLEGCPGCRAEARSLAGVAVLLPHADLERLGPSPQPPRELGERVMSAVGGERRVRQRRRRLRFGFALGGIAAAAATAVLLLVVLPGGGASPPQQEVAFTAVPKGVEISATLVPQVYGTEIHMYVSGIRSGTLCRVFLRGPGGKPYPAGSFRYRWGSDSEAVLSSALDLSRTTAIGVHAGSETFVAPLDRQTASTAAMPAQKQT